MCVSRASKDSQVPNSINYKYGAVTRFVAYCLCDTERGRVDLAEENLKEHQQRLSTQDQNHIHEGQSTEESEDSIVFRTRPKLSPLVKDVLQSSIEGLAVGISFAVGTSLPINSASYKNIDTTIGISTTTAVCLYRLSRDLQEAKFWVRNSYSFSSVFTSKVLMATLALIGGALGKHSPCIVLDS